MKSLISVFSFRFSVFLFSAFSFLFSAFLLLGQQKLSEALIAKTPANANSLAATNSAARTNRPAGRPAVGPPSRAMPKVPAEVAPSTNHHVPKGKRNNVTP